MKTSYQLFATPSQISMQLCSGATATRILGRHPSVKSHCEQLFVRSQGQQRQEALIGKLLRGLEDEDAAAISDALGRAKTGRASAVGSTAPAEQLALSWRDGLIAGAGFECDEADNASTTKTINEGSSQTSTATANAA